MIGTVPSAGQRRVHVTEWHDGGTAYISTREMPSFLIRAWSVVRFMPSRDAGLADQQVRDFLAHAFGFELSEDQRLFSP
jgi:hypothetical protein